MSVQPYLPFLATHIQKVVTWLSTSFSHTVWLETKKKKLVVFVNTLN